MEGDRPESAELQGRICSICFLPMEEDMECPTCCHIGNRLTDIQHECETTSLIRAIEGPKRVESRYSNMGYSLLVKSTLATLCLKGTSHVRS